MAVDFQLPGSPMRPVAVTLLRPSIAIALILATACAQATSTSSGNPAAAPRPDPRIGLRAGVMDAGEASWNLRLLSRTPPPEKFVGKVNSDLAFTGKYVIQGSFDGYQVWDISNPRLPTLKTAYVCPASQSDVSVYRNLLFVSGESRNARLDCGIQGVKGTVSAERLRGLRIFDISDITNPRNVGNVQTCRGSHTHTVLVDPKDTANVYVYISGSSGVRSPNELPGCVRARPAADPNSALFRIEVIKVPVAHPELAAIVSSPRIFDDLVESERHGEVPEDIAAARRELDSARAAGAFIATTRGRDSVISETRTTELLDSLVEARSGTGAPTGADSATLRRVLPAMRLAVQLEGDAGAARDAARVRMLAGAVRDLSAASR